MATEPQAALRLEIGHVLFIDIVGYSKLLITEQSQQLQTPKANRAKHGAIPPRESGRQTAGLTDW
jgi:hypothetical protein